MNIEHLLAMILSYSVDEKIMIPNIFGLLDLNEEHKFQLSPNQTLKFLKIAMKIPDLYDIQNIIQESGEQYFIKHKIDIFYRILKRIKSDNQINQIQQKHLNSLLALFNKLNHKNGIALLSQYQYLQKQELTDPEPPKQVITIEELPQSIMLLNNLTKLHIPLPELLYGISFTRESIHLNKDPRFLNALYEQIKQIKVNNNDINNQNEEQTIYLHLNLLIEQSDNYGKRLQQIIQDTSIIELIDNQQNQDKLICKQLRQLSKMLTDHSTSNIAYYHIKMHKIIRNQLRDIYINHSLKHNIPLPEIMYCIRIKNEHLTLVLRQLFLFDMVKCEQLSQLSNSIRVDLYTSSHSRKKLDLEEYRISLIPHWKECEDSFSNPQILLNLLKIVYNQRQSISEKLIKIYTDKALQDVLQYYSMNMQRLRKSQTFEVLAQCGMIMLELQEYLHKHSLKSTQYYSQEQRITELKKECAELEPPPTQKLSSWEKSKSDKFILKCLSLMIEKGNPYPFIIPYLMISYKYNCPILLLKKCESLIYQFENSLNVQNFIHNQIRTEEEQECIRNIIRLTELDDVQIIKERSIQNEQKIIIEMLKLCEQQYFRIREELIQIFSDCRVELFRLELKEACTLYPRCYAYVQETEKILGTLYKLISQ